MFPNSWCSWADPVPLWLTIGSYEATDTVGCPDMSHPTLPIADAGPEGSSIAITTPGAARSATSIFLCQCMFPHLSLSPDRTATARLLVPPRSAVPGSADPGWTLTSVSKITPAVSHSQHSAATTRPTSGTLG